MDETTCIGSEPKIRKTSSTCLVAELLREACRIFSRTICLGFYFLDCVHCRSWAMPSSPVSSPLKKNDWLWEFECQLYWTADQPKVVIGVDGGGTKTACICVATPLPTSGDDLSPLSRVETGCSNYNSVGGMHSLCLVYVQYNFGSYRFGAKVKWIRSFLSFVAFSFKNSGQ